MVDGSTADSPKMPLRHILFVRALEEVDGWRLFLFKGRSVFRLRNQLVRRLRPMIDLDDSELVMGLPTRDGRMFPLVVDLPSSGHTLHIFLTIVGTPGEKPS